MTKRSKQRRVLIVAHDTSVASRLADLLLERGHLATVQRDAGAAMSALSADAPDLVVLCRGAGREPDYALGATLTAMFEVPYLVLGESWDEGAARAAADNGALTFLAGGSAGLHECIPAIIAAMERHAELRELQVRMGQVVQALQHARTISAACGVLMERLHLNRDEAFETLRAAARSRRMRLLDTAEGMLVALEALNQVGEDGAQRAAGRDCDRVRSSPRKSR